jgi:hypothetical protein
LLQELELLNAESTRREGKANSEVFLPHPPHRKQQMFLDLDNEKEVMTGGACGGGKSDALLMAALKYVHVPNYSALILRRTYADLSLPNSIMDRAQTWLRNTSAQWRAVDKQWIFPSGARITFGYINVERDRFRYSSAEFQCICFDELTQFPEKWYKFLFSRLRGPVDPANPLSKVPLRMRSATNPGGIGHEWVRANFSIPDIIDFNHVYRSNGRCFLPSRLEDNPTLDQATYDEMLANLGPAEREQLRHGRWVRDAEMLVYRYFDESQTLVDEVPELDSYILGIDFGYRDATAFTIIGWRKDDPIAYIVQSFKRTSMTPSDVAEVVTELMPAYNFQKIVGDLGGLGQGYAQEMIQRHGIPIEAAEKTNKRGYIDLFNGAMANGKMKVLRAGTEELCDEWKKLPWSDENKLKSHEGFDDHCADSALYSWRSTYSFLEHTPAAEPEHGTPEWRKSINDKMAEARRRNQIGEAVKSQQPHWRLHPSERRNRLR